MRLYLTPTVHEYALHIGRAIGQAIEITYYEQPKPRQSRKRLARLSATATAPASTPPAEVENASPMPVMGNPSPIPSPELPPPPPATTTTAPAVASVEGSPVASVEGSPVLQLAHSEDDSDVIIIDDSDSDEAPMRDEEAMPGIGQASTAIMNSNPPVLAKVLRAHQSPRPFIAEELRRILNIGEPSTSDGRTHDDNNIKKRKSTTNSDNSTIKQLKVKRLKLAIAVKEAQLLILDTFTRKMVAGELTYINIGEGGLPEMPRDAPMPPDNAAEQMEMDSDDSDE